MMGNSPFAVLSVLKAYLQDHLRVHSKRKSLADPSVVKYFPTQFFKTTDYRSYNREHIQHYTYSGMFSSYLCNSRQFFL